MKKNTEGHVSYMTQSIVYPVSANGLGPALTFQGPFSAFQAYDAEVHYIAEVMDEYTDYFLTSKDPVWQISARLSCELKIPVQKVNTEIILIEKLSEDRAKQMLFALQEENVRLMLYNTAVHDAELTEDDLSGEIFVFPKGEDPTESKNESYVWREENLENEFPYHVTTRQVLTDYNSFYEIRRQIKEFDQEEAEAEESAYQDSYEQEESDEEEYPDYYRPVSEVDMDALITDLRLDESIAEKAEKNIRELQRPIQFIAELVPSLVAVVENEDGKNAPDIQTKCQGKWKVSAVESLGCKELMVLDHFRDAMYTLCILEEAIIDPAAAPDTYHQVISDKNYGNHYSIWHNKADEIDRRLDRLDCPF